MVPIGLGAERLIADVMLTGYACYFMSQNGDLRKPAALSPAEDVKNVE